MVVKTQGKGSSITGLLIGMGNARRYFPKGVSSVELQLDHLQIQCELKREQWDGEATITDARLIAWLEAKHPNRRFECNGITLMLVPSGDNAFRVEPHTLHAVTKTALPQNAA
jgi:hypothetical protein